ncbi:MAG TPA: hypothetical protein VEJ63_21450 [Planctomycetota bacterium]|nr:hypothetical protein [Planctomycetota bacterium]
MEAAVSAPAQEHTSGRRQISLLSAVIIMLLLAVIVGMGVKVWSQQEHIDLLRKEQAVLKKHIENLEVEKSMVEYSLKKYREL